MFTGKHWKQPRCKGPFKVILTTPTAVKVEGKEYWHHLNHCCRATGKDSEKPTLETELVTKSEDSDVDKPDPVTEGPAQNTRTRIRASP